MDAPLGVRFWGTTVIGGFWERIGSGAIDPIRKWGGSRNGAATAEASAF